MTTVFFDTSALVRRYDATEPGAATVRELCRRSSARTLLIVELTAIEVASALARKVREGVIGVDQMYRLWRQFRYHARYQYQVNQLDQDTFRRAARLVFRHQLRAADALQLAGAMQAQRALEASEPDFRFCTADQRQRHAAEAERLTVEFIS